jgi:CRP-like cAMP-binding protein
MTVDYNSLRRIPVDPRVIERIQKSSEMQYEQGSDFMSGWGGPARYRALTKLPMEQRICYAAILEGVTTEDQIGIVTGLSPEETSRGLAGLQAKGLVSVEKVTV